MQNHNIAIWKNPAYWYTVLWMMYYMGGTLYAVGSIISKAILAMILIISFYHMFTCLGYKDNPQMLKGVTAIVFLVTIYGFFRLFGPSYFGISKFLFQKNIYLSLLPIFSFYYYTKRGYLREKDMIVLTFVFVVFTYVVYLNDVNTRSLISGEEVGDMTVNSGYNFIGLLPFVFLFRKKPVWFFTILFFIWFFTILCMKRGAIVSGLAATLILFSNYFKSSKRGIKIGALVLVSVFIIVIVYYVQGLMNDNSYFALRYQQTMEGNASGREEMYPMFFRYLLHENTVITALVGGGIDYSLVRFEMGAHSDWFQIAIDMGLVGIVFYIYYWSKFVKTIKHIGKKNSYYTIMLIVFIIDFLKSFFSFSINNRPIVTTCILGFCLAAPYVMNRELTEQNTSN